MRISRLPIIVLSMLLPLSIQAQKPKKKVVKKPVVVVAPEPEEDPRITEMRELTQQIVFIDSCVTDKDNILPHLRLNAESGQLIHYNKFFHQEGHTNAIVYLNEMGNKCYFSDRNDQNRMQLYTCDKLGHEWSEPMALGGILSDDISEAGYPFMMTDGTTFYFAAKGQESIGGYDIFVTRYDSGEGQFLKPENIGMPFNSEANDYLYVIDEFSNIGYFVTDRRQPEGKVCIYTFIPPTSRRTYNTDNYSADQIRSLADISSIAKTWGNGKERKAALERLSAVSSSAGKPAGTSLHFVINDQVTYTSVSQFRSPESPKLFRELTDVRRRLSETERLLEESRTYYARAKASDKQLLRSDILDAEQQVERLAGEAKTLEKRIRNEENHIINP